MSAGQHTPGPWTLNPAHSTRVDLIDNAKGHAIGEIVWVDVRNPADASLIAAAPDLLAVVQDCVRWYANRNPEDDDPWPFKNQPPEIQRAMTAIAKATGGAV